MSRYPRYPFGKNSQAKATSLMLAAGMLLMQSFPALALTINSGQTLYVESTPGNWYVDNQSGTTVINGTLRGVERVSPGGAATGNGANVRLNADAIVIGSGGLIDLSAYAMNGNGGNLILNAPVITQDGMIRVDGLGTGNGGSVSILAGSYTMGSTGRIYARGGANGGLGGVVTIDTTGAVDIQQGGSIITNGVTGYSGGQVVNNLISIEGAGVNVAGSLYAHGTSTSDGGKITVANTGSGNVSVASTGLVTAVGGTGGDGGVIQINTTITGNVALDGKVTANGGAGGSGGVISVNSVGNITSDGVSGAILSQGGTGSGTTSHGGSVSLTAANDIVISNAALVDVSGAGNTSGGGNGGIITMTAQGGDVRLEGGRVSARGYKGANGGTVNLSAADMVVMDNSAYIAANSYDYGTNSGSGGNVSLSGTNGITIDAHTSYQSINASAAKSPSSYVANGGNGGTISLTSTAGDITINSNTATLGVAVLEANGAAGTNPGKGGTVTFDARNLSMIGNAAHWKKLFVQAMGGKGRGTTTGQGGSITADLTGNFTLTLGAIRVDAGVRDSGFGGNMNGTGGSVDINLPGEVNITQGTITANTFGNGGGGSISIESTGGDININDVDSYVQNLTNGSGSVTLTAQNIYNAGKIESKGNVRASDGGTINITTDNAGTLTNDGVINASHRYFPDENDNIGDGGTININAGDVIVTAKDANIIASGGFDANTGERGQGGVINITASGTLTTGDMLIDVSGTPVTSGGSYTKGKINIVAGSADLSGRIRAAGSYGNDAGGYIGITTTSGDLVVNSVAEITANGDRGDLGHNAGNGGQVVLRANNGNIDVQGLVHANGDGGYNGGSVELNASGAVTFSGSGRVEARGMDAARTGNGGNITINAGSLAINNTDNTITHINASGNTHTGGGQGGDGGSISITTSGATTLTSNQDSNTQALIASSGGGGGSAGDGGSVVINAGSLTMESTAAGNRLIVSAESAGAGQGGTIDLASDGTASVTKANFSSKSTGGTGGSATISAVDALTVDNSQFDTSGATNGSTTLLSNDSTTTTGSVYNGDTVLQANNTVTAVTGNTFNGTISAYGDAGSGDYAGTVNITTTSGDITIARITANTANITANDTGANVTLSNPYSNNGQITVTAEGNITLSGGVVDGTDTIHLNSTNNGTIVLNNTYLSSVTGTTAAPTGTGGVFFGNGNGGVVLNTVTVTGSTTIGSGAIPMQGDILGTANTFIGSTAFYTNLSNNDISLTNTDFQSASNTFGARNVTLTDRAGHFTIASLTATNLTATASGTQGDFTLSNATVTGTAALTANRHVIATDNNNFGAAVQASSTGGGDLSVTDNAGNLTVTLLSSTGNANLTASGGNITLSGANMTGASKTTTFQAASTVDASAANNNFAGTVTAHGLSGPGSALSTVSIRSSGNLTVDNILTNSATYHAAGVNLTLSNGTITSDATLQASGSITGTTNNDFGNTTAATAGTNITLSDKSGAFSLSGVNSGWNTTLSSVTGGITLDNASVGNTLSLTAGTPNTNHSLEISNTSVTGTSTLAAGNTITATSNNVFSGGVTAHGESGTADYASQVDIANASGNLTVSRLTATNASLATSGAGSAVSVSNVETNDGTISITSPGNISISNSTITAFDTLLASSTGNGTVNLSSNTFRTLEGKSALTGSENRGVYIGNGSGAWTLSGNTVNLTTSISSGSTITGTSGKYTGALTAAGTNVYIVASSGDLTLDNITATAGSVTVAAQSGTLSLGAGKTVSATSAVSMTAGGGDMTIDGAVNGPAGITLNASGTVLANSTSTFTGMLNGTAGRYDFTSNSNLVLGNLNATSTGIIMRANNGAYVYLAGGKTLNAARAVWLNSQSSNITINGSISSGNNNISLYAEEGTITGTAGSITGGITASANTINLTNTSGSITLKDVTTDIGDITFTAADGISLISSLTLTSPTKVTLKANTGAISLTGNIIAPVIDLTADGASGGITLTDSNLTARDSTGAGGIISLHSSGTIDSTNTWYTASVNNGLLQGGNVSLVSTGGAVNINSGPILTNGQSDATHNVINLQGTSVKVSGRLDADGIANEGGSGGTVTLTSTVGEVRVTKPIEARGYAANTQRPGNGGTVTITAAGDYVQTGSGRILTSSHGSGQGLNGANDGGTVTITAGGTISITNNGSNTSIDTHGNSYTEGTNLYGGDAGNIILNATSAINLNYNSTGNPLYFDASGGDGISAGYSGGNGGTIEFNVNSGVVNIDNYHSTKSFDVTGGTGSGNGTNGEVLKNGSPL